jgi:hypothetical protein
VGLGWSCAHFGVKAEIGFSSRSAKAGCKHGSDSAHWILDADN